MAKRGERKAKRPKAALRPRRSGLVFRQALLVLAAVGLGVALTAAGRALREPGAPALADFRIAAGTALGALVTGALYLLAERRAVKRPARALAKAMADLEAAAEMDMPVKVAAEGELGALVAGYNRMVEQVEARRRDAAEQIYILEQLAQLRTADLAEAREAQAAAEAAHAELSDALRHEFAAPLDGLSRVAETLAAAPAPQPLARTLAGVAASLAGAVRDVLAGREPTADTAGAVEVADCVEDVAAMFWPAATAKGVDLAVYIDPATPKTIQGDPMRLRQVMTNLVAAAVQATETGGVLIEVEPDSPASIRLSVRDTRPAGVEPGDPPGFARCRRLVEAMDGRFQTCRDERGAAYAFRLPAVLLEPPSAWPEPPEPGAAARIACEGVATRRVLARYLARAGYALPTGPDAAAELIIAAPAALSPPPGAPTVCVAPSAERGERAVRTGLAHAMLLQPFRRAELAELLAQRQLGEALASAPAAAAAVPAPAPLPSLAPAPTRKTPPAETEALLADLEKAIADDALSLVYQPQFDREGREITGVETLVRWVHPTRGAVSPALFIPMAEEYGRIHRLTDWVMARALTETAELDGLQVAFNASALEFTDAGIVARIGDLLAKTGFDPRRLEVEITETAILENEEQVRDNMNALRAMGLKVALDDFGAGYSSLGHLRRYPFDKLKIDREFVIDCTRDVQSATVVHAVVSIGRALGMRVVAEGVETEHQRQFLKIAGVHAMQGYLFGKPMPVDALRATLAEVTASARMG